MIEVSTNRKLSLILDDGLTVETVYYGSGTLCVSSQAGCGVKCPFCASGRTGLIRSLSVREMVAQVEEALLSGIRPRRVTISGIGDPLHNAGEVSGFMALCRENGLPVSLTTVGNPLSQLERFLPGPDNGLTISLHSGTAATHRRLIPGGPDWGDLWELLGMVLPCLSRRRRRRLGINYLLLKGVNDGPGVIGSLFDLLRPWPDLTLHLLECNPVPGSPFVRTGPGRTAAIRAQARRKGIHARRANPWRNSLGGCGTLAASKCR